jgi:hypothetical protein
MDPLLTPTSLKCPRCGARFKPTVPWNYVRLLFIVVIALALLLIVLLTRGNLLWFLFSVVALGITGCFWYISRAIHLHQIGPELNPSEGVLDSKQLELALDDSRFSQEYEERREKSRFRRAVGLLVILLVVIVGMMIWWSLT